MNKIKEDGEEGTHGISGGEVDGRDSRTDDSGLQGPKNGIEETIWIKMGE